MKTYPSIPTYRRSKGIPDTNIVAFDKIDGSNISAEWSAKRGFYKLGSKNQLIASDNPLYEAKGLLDAQAPALGAIFRKRWKRAVAFFEFWGPNSFAGSHEQEPHQLTLIDVSVDKKGILEPDDFTNLFYEVGTAPVLYRGPVTELFVSKVRDGSLSGMSFEGVVCKGKYKSPGLPWMFKIKSDAWYDKLKEKCGDNTDLFNMLA